MSAKMGAIPGRYLATGAVNQDSTLVKGSSGKIYSLVILNTQAQIRYVKLYDKATAPASTDTPVQTIGIPGGSNGAGLVLPVPPIGMEFDNGIGFRITSGAADNDVGTCAANDVILSYTYR